MMSYNILVIIFCSDIIVIFLLMILLRLNEINGGFKDFWFLIMFLLIEMVYFLLFFVL